MQVSNICIKCKSLKSLKEFKVRKNGTLNKTCDLCLNPRRKTKIEKKYKTEFLSTIPDELIYIILENLENVRDLVSISCTNKRFNRICKDLKLDNEHNVLYTKIKTIENLEKSL
jgi:hypothetical protein